MHSLPNCWTNTKKNMDFKTNGTVTGFNYTDTQNGSLDATNAMVVSTNQPKGKW
jgi:hypothetical protein